MFRLIACALLALVSSSTFAFKCYITVIKDSCWKNYNVNVAVLDAVESDRVIKQVSVPKGTPWARDTFDCQPNQQLKMQATFTPVFWEADSGKKYDGLKYWTLPAQIGKGETAWNLTICYPNKFAEVPLPLDAQSHCVCDASKIPPVEPE